MNSVLSAYFKSTRVQTAAALLFLLSGGLTQVPLFNYLGYEFSALMTIPAALVSGVLTILWMREHRALPLTRRTWLSTIGDYLTVNSILLLIPFIIITLNAFSIRNCAFAKGVMYYILLPGFTMIFAVPLALVIGTVFRRGVTVFIISVFVILSHIVLITYGQPQLFAYNFILGYFPGITYDETSTDISALIIYRQFTLIASVMLFALFLILLRNMGAGERLMPNLRRVARNLRHDRMLSGIVLFCAAVLGAAHLFRDDLGFEYSAEGIRRELGRRSESSHFVFYYHHGDYSADEMRKLKAEAEFHLRKVMERLALAERPAEKIAVFIYPNGEWKQRFIGTATTNIAKPWRREIHLTAPTFAATFRHELVHIMASESGFPVVRASLRMGMNEGLAVAVDWNEGLFTPHHYAAALHRLDKLGHVDQLFTITGFASQSGSFAYLVSGSFVRYLIDRYGAARVLTAFPNGLFMAAFGESLESLLKDWKAFLKTVDISALPDETVKSIFFQPSIFYKVCAREVADQNLEAARAIRNKEYDKAERLYRASYDNAPTGSSLRGIFHAMNAQRNPKEVLRMFASLPENSMFRSQPGILLIAGDALYLDGKMSEAAEKYQKVRSMQYSETIIEASLLRSNYLSDSISSADFHSIFYGGMDDSAKSVYILHALNTVKQSTALTYHHAVLSTQSGAQWDGVLNADKKSPASFPLQYFALKRKAEAAYARDQFEEAKRLYWQAKNVAPTDAASLGLDEMIELCEFTALESL